MFYKKQILIISLCALFAANASFGASQPAELTLSVSPEFPKTGEQFTVEAKSYTADNSRSTFRWFLNGKSVASGVGLTSQTFTASRLGSAMSIDVNMTSTDGQIFSRNITVYVADVDLIIKPNTYVPSYYRGSPLATVPGGIEIFAVPHLYSSKGARIAAENLIYEWSLNGNKLRSDSGPGKNKLQFTMPDVGGLRYSIKLKITDSSGAISASKTVSMPAVEPQLLFYETNSLLGRSQNANVSFEVKGGENISVLAEPYFFGLSSLPVAILSWFADNKAFQQPADKNPLILEIEAPQNAVSLTNFLLLINDKKTIRQRAQAQFNIKTTQ